jgi:YVTN family beta-propeller protein
MRHSSLSILVLSSVGAFACGDGGGESTPTGGTTVADAGPGGSGGEPTPDAGPGGSGGTAGSGGTGGAPTPDAGPGGSGGTGGSGGAPAPDAGLGGTGGTGGAPDPDAGPGGSGGSGGSRAPDAGLPPDPDAAAPPPAGPVLPRPSRSTAVDITADDQYVAMANSDDGSVSFFRVAQNGQEARTARVATSALAASEPVSVVYSPDGQHLFVANRAAGTVSRLDAVRTDAPRLGAEIPAGAEPMGLALSPTGASLYVTDWMGGSVRVIDTATMTERQRIDVGGNPFALTITNDGDADDDDEKALVTQFYGRADAEGTDTGRTGLVHVIPLAQAAVTRTIELAPLVACFTGDLGAPPAPVTSACSPNQLYGITLQPSDAGLRAYVLSVGASPEGPVNFAHSVQALVSVIDVDTEAEIPGATVNLNRLVAEQQTDPDGDESVGRRFLNVPNALAFVNRADAAIGYVTSAGSDVVLRVVFDPIGGASVGSGVNFNIPVGQNPQGIVTRHGVMDPEGTDAADAFVANLVSRDLSTLSFRDQAQARALEASPRPDAGSPAFGAWKGKRFFNTSTGIWAKEGWGSCQGCHPMGLTDNITWRFGAGPRQTTSLDGQFASDDPSDMRALNWTAIFDETHDFENNTRGTSGGKGALLDAAGNRLVSAMGPPFAALPVGAATENHQGLNGSLTAISDDAAVCSNANTCPDWNLVDQYIQTIRTPRAPQAQAAQLGRGRALFEDAGCTKCHAGAKWTVSRTFYDPAAFVEEGGARVFAANRAASTPMDPSVLRGLPRNVNLDDTLIDTDDSDGGTPALKRQACNIRNVGSFDAAGGAPEVRDNGTPAQGRNGYNPPSLLGLAAGAPYLHHGAADTLPDLLAALPDHTRAGNPNFLPSEGDVADLTAFLLSIDESTPVFPIEAGTVLCPEGFAP